MRTANIIEDKLFRYEVEGYPEKHLTKAAAMAAAWKAGFTHVTNGHKPGPAKIPAKYHQEPEYSKGQIGHFEWLRQERFWERNARTIKTVVDLEEKKRFSVFEMFFDIIKTSGKPDFKPFLRLGLSEFQVKTMARFFLILLQVHKAWDIEAQAEA
jgi:hypothetical protein